MKTLHIEKTRSTPEISFEPDRCKLKITGQSYPENAFKFYEPVLQWLEWYLTERDSEMVLDLYFHMPYINTSSAKCIMMLLEKLEEANQNGKKVSVQWYYDVENEVALECAEEFQEDLALPFRMVPLEGDA